MIKTINHILVYGINLCLLIWDLVYNMIPALIMRLFVKDYVVSTILLLGGLFRSKLLSDWIIKFKKGVKLNG